MLTVLASHVPNQPSSLHEFVHVGNSASHQRRRRLQTHRSKYGSAEDSDIFEMVQAQISNLKLRDEDIYGLFRSSGLDSWSLEKLFSDSVRFLDGNVPMILKKQDFGKAIELNIWLQAHHRRTHGMRMEALRGENEIEILECNEKMLGEEGGQPSQFQGRVIFMSMYSDSLRWDPQKKKAYVETLQAVLTW